jgi:cytochrome P450
MLDDSPPEFLAGIRLMMLNMDPPQHTKLRALVNKGFTPRMVAGLESRIRGLARHIVDAVAPRGACDFVADVAGELPSYVIAELVGIPLDDGRRLYALTERMHTTDRSLEGMAHAQAAVGEMMTYASELRAAKAARPGADLASALVAAEVDGERLTDLEFNLFFMLLINAGGDTTRNLVAGGMLTLLRHADQLALLRREPARLPAAIEEMLRFQSPVQHFRRTATRDTTLGGREIAAGQKVVIYYTSANRDAARFVEPDRFDVRRTPNEHVAFGGGGTHFCLGANLARLEIRAMFEEVLTRLDQIVLDGPVEWLPSIFINGPRRMPVRFRAI